MCYTTSWVQLIGVDISLEYDWRRIRTYNVPVETYSEEKWLAEEQTVQTAMW